MHNLKELTYIVTKNKLKSIELLDSESSSRVMEFYEGIVQGKFKSDEAAAAYFFDNQENGRSYNKLKNALKKKLLNTLFFIDVKQPSYNDRQRAYYECHKDWAAASILYGKNAHISAMELSHRILKHALKYEFTGLALDIMCKLRLYYATKIGDLKKYNHFKALCNVYEPVLRAEKQAEGLYLDLTIYYVNNKSAKKEIQTAAIQAYEKIKADLKKYDSYNLHLYGALIRLVIDTSLNDYKAALAVCEDVITLFKGKNYPANTPLQIAYYQQLVCYTQLREYEKGKMAAKNCLRLIDPGAFNWFKYHELYLILALHTKEYHEAYTTFIKVKRHKRFKFLPDNIQEIWRIFEAYLYYLINIGVLVSTENSGLFAKFKLAKFINDTPIFSRDKAGLNIAILAIQILFLIRQKNYNRVIDKAEAIDKYCSRYLRKEETIRSYYFIKMLLTIQMASFDKTTVIKKANPYLTKLRGIPFDVANQDHNIEIIPYETLWGFALESLENNFAPME